MNLSKLTVERITRVIRARVQRMYSNNVYLLQPKKVEDIVNDVWVHLLEQDQRRLNRYDPERGSIEAYVNVVTQRYVLDMLDHGGTGKSGASKETVDLADLTNSVACPGPSPDNSAIHRQFFNLFWPTFWDSLTETEQRFANHYFAEGLEYEKIMVEMERASVAALQNLKSKIVHKARKIQKELESEAYRPCSPAPIG